MDIEQSLCLLARAVLRMIKIKICKKFARSTDKFINKMSKSILTHLNEIDFIHGP